MLFSVDFAEQVIVDKEKYDSVLLPLSLSAILLRFPK